MGDDLKDFCVCGPDPIEDSDVPVAEKCAPCEAADRIAELEAEVERLREPIPDTYACQKCGRRDGLDCVIPNHLWNEVEVETGCGVLCTWCLDAHLADKGVEVRALLAFVGKAINAGTDPQNDDAHWERHLGDLTGRCSEANERAARPGSAKPARRRWRKRQTSPQNKAE